LAKGDRAAHVGDILRPQLLVVLDSDPLDRVIDQMQSQRQPLAVVERNGELVGLLSEEHIGQWVMLHSSLGKSQNPRSEDESRERSPVSLP